MRKTYAMKDFFGVAILLLFALIIVFFSLIGFVTVKPKKVTFSKPFFHHVNEIAVNGDDIYTLDQTFNYICKYNHSGEFQFAISFSSSGQNYIYINADGFLCRYDLKQNIEYLYDEKGVQIEYRQLFYEDFMIFRSTQNITTIHTNGKTYEYHNRMVFNSVIEITSSDGSQTSIVVESFVFHCVWAVLIFLLLSSVIFCGWQIYQFVLTNKRKVRMNTGGISLPY